MIGLLPGRLATRQRLLVGTLLVAGTNLLSLAPLDIGPFGSPWPIGLLWAACGWAGLGPNVTTASLLFFLGFWADATTGAQLGTWSAVALLTHGITCLLARFVGLSGLGLIGKASVVGFAMVVCIFVLSALQGTNGSPLGALLSVITAILLYRLVGKFFELREDET